MSMWLPFLGQSKIVMHGGRLGKVVEWLTIRAGSGEREKVQRCVIGSDVLVGIGKEHGRIFPWAHVYPIAKAVVGSSGAGGGVP